MGLFDFLAGLFGGDDDRVESQSTSAGDTETPRSTDDEDETTDVSEYGPAQFRREAEEFATDHEDRNFDFSVESLERLDEYAASQTAVLDAMDEEVDGENGVLGGLRRGYVLWWGSYFGEVLVRQFDAEWVTDEDSVYVRVPTAVQPVEIYVLDAALGAVDGDPQFAATAADLESDVEAAEDAAETDSPAPEAVLESLDLDPSVELADAHERAVEAFRTSGYQVSQGDVMNSVSDRAAADCTRMFTFYRGSEMHVGIVYRGEWDDDDTNGVVALISNLRGGGHVAGVHVVSARELPDSISYLTGTDPRGAFAVAALVEVQNGPAFDPTSAAHYAEVGQELLAQHLDVDIDVDDPDALERIDDAVLSQLRTEPQNRPQEGYTPREALVVVGALAGEVMRAALEREYPVETEWSADASVSSTGVVVTVRGTETGEEASVNPVGKAFKLFESGSADSIAFMYETVTGIVEDDLV